MHSILVLTRIRHFGWVPKIPVSKSLTLLEHSLSHCTQILALVVTVVGFLCTLPFQIFIREKSNVQVKKLEWYKWLKNPQFYLVNQNDLIQVVIAFMSLFHV